MAGHKLKGTGSMGKWEGPTMGATIAPQGGVPRVFAGAGGRAESSATARGFALSVQPHVFWRAKNPTCPSQPQAASRNRGSSRTPKLEPPDRLEQPSLCASQASRTSEFGIRLYGISVVMRAVDLSLKVAIQTTRCVSLRLRVTPMLLAVLRSKLKAVRRLPLMVSPSRNSRRG